MSTVKFRYEFRSVDVVPGFPGIVLDSEALPFNEVPQFVVHYLAI